MHRPLACHLGRPAYESSRCQQWAASQLGQRQQSLYMHNLATHTLVTQLVLRPDSVLIEHRIDFYLQVAALCSELEHPVIVQTRGLIQCALQHMISM